MIITYGWPSSCVPPACQVLEFFWKTTSRGITQCFGTQEPQHLRTTAGHSAPCRLRLGKVLIGMGKRLKASLLVGIVGVGRVRGFRGTLQKNLNDIEIFGKFVTPIRKNRLRKTTIEWESCSSNTPKVSETMTSAFSSSEKVKVVLWPSLTWIDSFKGSFSWPKTNQFWIKFDLKHHNIIQTFYKPSQSKQNIRYPGIRRRRLCRHM